MIYRTLLGLWLTITLLAGCSTAKDLTKFRDAKVRSILIVPTVNKSVDVKASDYLLSTLSIPVAESGFYVFPANLVKRTLEDDGLSDSVVVHQAPTERVAALFGADAVLYVSIEKWTAKYLLLSTSVEVEISYVLKSGKTGEVLWEEHREKSYVPPNSSSGNVFVDLIAAAVTAAATKAAPNYMPIARLANKDAFDYPGPGLLRGPYATQNRAAATVAKVPDQGARRPTSVK